MFLNEIHQVDMDLWEVGLNLSNDKPNKNSSSFQVTFLEGDKVNVSARFDSIKNKNK